MNTLIRLCYKKMDSFYEVMIVKPKIRITLVDQKGSCQCHHGHKIGDSFDFDTERGKLCPMALHVAFPYIDILIYCAMAARHIFPKAARYCFAARIPTL